MKIGTLFIVLMGLVFSNPSMAKKIEISKQPLVKNFGLSAVLDSTTGYEQIYYRSGFNKKIQLTTTDSDKTLPQWGASGVTYYFYDRVENKILTCEGRLFYYLELGDDETNQLKLGCVATDTSASPSVIEGYPLTGFGDGPKAIDEYYVAEGTDLSYDFDGTTHQAIPLVAYEGDEEVIVMHDDEANLGTTNYDDGFVTYYDDGVTGDVETGWSATPDDNVGWTGSIACPRCPRDNQPGESGRPEEQDETDPDVVVSDDETETTDVDQTSNQSTDVDNSNSNANTSSADQSQDSENANNVTITVDVNVTNTNSAASESSSDDSGSVSSSSSAVGSTDTTSTDDSSTPDDVSASVSAADTEESIPDFGGFSMTGGGGCSLTQTNTIPSNIGLVLMMTIFLSLCLIRKGALSYERGL